MSKLVGVDVGLVRGYLAALVCLQSAWDHLRSPDRIEPFELATASDRAVLGAVHRVFAATGEVDAHAVQSELESAGSPYAADVRALTDGQCELGALRPVVERLRWLRRQREVHAILMQAVAASEDGRTDDAIEMALLAGDARTQTSVEIDSAQATVESALSQLYNRTQREWMRTGFPLIDSAIGGLPKRTMTVIGGTTGSGKSSVCLATAINCARLGQRVGIVSTEDADTVWGPRVLSHLVEVNSTNFYSEKIDHDFVARAEEGIELAARVGVEFAWALNRPLADVLAAVRALVSDKRCELIVVDYIQAIVLDGSDHRIAIKQAVQAIKGQCQALNVPLILTSQLKRSPDDKPFREPHNGMLKEAGELENMSEVILLLWQKGDGEMAPTFGKVSKIKWSPWRPRFEVQRNPRTGAVVSLVKPQEDSQPAPTRGRWKD